MFLKKLYQRTSSVVQQMTEKKLLSESVYNKFIVRSSLFKAQNVKVLDNGSNFFHISCYLKKKPFFKKGPIVKKNLINGRSVYGKKCFYANQLNKHLRFSFFSSNENFLPVNLLQNILKKNAIGFSTVLFLKPLKGGYRIYKEGIVGFIPKRHVLKLKKTTLLNKILVSKQVGLVSCKLGKSKKRFKTLKVNVNKKKPFVLKNLFLNHTLIL